MKKIRGFLLLLSAVFLGAFLLEGESAAAIPLKTFSKEDFPWEDTILTGVEPNVLFFLDTSSAMTMSMQGELPTFNTNDTIMQGSLSLMRDANFRAGLLAQATYGAGSRPVSNGTQTAADRLLTGGVPNTGTERTGYFYNPGYSSQRLGYSRWGRDLDVSNNVIGNPNCYYTPDPNKPYLLTFKDRNWANWNGNGNPPQAYGNGLADADSGSVAAINMPTGLQYYLPGGGGYGQAITDPNLVQYLVPNDSKMYQMKLALWRLLESGNAQMLSQMRVGAAGNFFDYLYGLTIRGAMYRRPPYRSYGADANEGDGTYQGNNTANFQATHMGAANQWISFPHGTAPQSYSGIIGGDYGHTEILFSGVLTSYEDGGEVSQRHERRAYLRIPFDFMYTKNANGTYNPTSTLFTFRELIDGVEQFNPNQAANANKIVNEELIAGGTTMLSTSFYGRDGLHATGSDETSWTNHPVLNGRNAVEYARGALTARELWPGIYSSSNAYGILAKRIRNSEGLMSGTAMGSAIDFFSPLRGNTGLSYTEYPAGDSGVEADDTRGYFPVTGSCQANWMVVFTGGNEMAIPGYDPVESLKKLYLNSKKLRGRHWDGEKWIERTYDMDSPIRTVFVGMLPPAPAGNPDGDPNAPDQAADPGAKRLRKAVTRMARAGQPLQDGTPNAAIQPHFADDVPKLIQALQSILLQIRAERFAAGAPIILPLGEGNELFAASYSINRFKQWEGTFHKYVINPDESETPMWRAEQKIIDKGTGRNVYTTTDTEGSTVTSVANLLAIPTDVFKALAGIAMGISNATVETFRAWLITYTNEPGVLGDMEHSSFAIVNKPAIANIPERDARIYLQTNRGVLHSLDRDNGEEQWAFIPPNIFQNRLRNQKFFPLDGSWYIGDGTTGIQSTPLVLLDGMLAPNDFKAGGDYKTLLIGNLGWGGNGFYAMDVTAAGNEPHFLWAVENARYSEQESSALDGVKLWGAAADSKNAHDYSDLGLTIAAAEIRSTAEYDEYEEKWILRDGVGILPGGLGYQYGADSQGKVFYVFNPINAEIIRKITTSNGFLAPSGNKLGMGIAPIYYIPEKGKFVEEDAVTSPREKSIVTKEFFTGDSEGNVLYCDMKSDPSDWDLKSVFQLRTLTGNHPVAIMKAFEVWKNSDSRWLFGGTSDLMVPGHRTLANEEQFIFGLNLRQNPNMGENPPSPPTPMVTADLVRLTYLSDDIFPSYQEGNVQVTVPSNAKGWVLKLRPKIIHPTEPTEAEYVTTAPFFYQGVVYVSTFVARTRQPDDDEKCPELGDGKLYAFDPLTGRGMWSGGRQALVFDNIKIAGISAIGGRMFLGIKILQGGALNALEQYEDLAGFKTYAESTTIAIKALGDPPRDEGDPNVPYNIPLLHYWKEDF
ncbi:MAG: hypothetical protein LBQ42_07420 [Synergistaceae bacterium]|jgi:type IV pilus assembly protein PilY1|nr:hypothetical protein [Synergistaceae bacterium]